MNERDSNSNRDVELDRLLENLKKTHPSAAQMSKWQSLAPKPVSSRKPFQNWFVFDSRRLMDFAMAASIGFIIATSIFYNRQKTESSDQTIFVAKNNLDSDATIERIYHKSQ